MTSFAPNPFRPALFEFLSGLAAHNTKEWFAANRRSYDEEMKDPALTFISDLGPHLAKISPHFNAIPKAVGGSLFRIYRDTRFSRDKRPYKTHLGIQFRHKQARDVHAPGFYLHVEPGACMVGVGIWHPDGPSLQRIRAAIDADPGGWLAARDGRAFRRRFALGGESLKRPPRGFAADHPQIEDLKRKDFIAFTELADDAVLAPGFPAVFTDHCAAAGPFVGWLCGAVGAKF
jgi:uncharacterized protein (TIGR02453 family)